MYAPEGLGLGEEISASLPRAESIRSGLEQAHNLLASLFQGVLSH